MNIDLFRRVSSCVLLVTIANVSSIATAADGIDASAAQLQSLAAGLTPAEAAERMTVPAGFHVALAAGEPQVHQPIAFTIDHRGRLWVAEAYTYPVRAPEGQGKDKIIILEDTTGDGQLDSRKVFAEGLNLVSGLEIGFGGVWVGAAPYLLFIPDEDGDDRPDSEPRILLDGFGYEDTHETLNAFIWGPDGWLYGCHGVFTHSRVGKPGTPDEERTPLNAGVWRYHPQRHQFEVFAWGTSNPWGVDFDSTGQAFLTACVIPHLYHFVQGARYERQGGQHFNPYVYEDIKTIADHRHYAGNIRDHAWWGKDVVDIPTDTSSAGGGHAHCGCMIYLGDNWPEKYRDTLFVCNIHGNRVNNEILEPRGSGFVGKHGKDIIFANDHWFRGINLRYGPDGSVYLIDWYDRNACHRATPEIWDRSNGRIYNVRYGEREPLHVDLAKLESRELVQLHMHRNEWYVRMARRLLQERGGDAATHTALRQIMQTATDTAVRLRALWTLHVTGGLSNADLLDLLSHEEAAVRCWAIQLALEDHAAEPELIAELERMAADDPSPRVRLYLAAALQRLPSGQRWGIAENLLAHAADADDHNLPLMIWYGVEPLAAASPQRALQLADAAKLPQVTRFLVRRVAAQEDHLPWVTAALAAAEDEQRQALLLEETLHALKGRADVKQPASWQAAYDKLTRSDSAAILRQADELALVFGDRRVLPRMRETLADRNAPLPLRTRALETLVDGRDTEAVSVMHTVLAEPALRGPALRGLANFDNAATPECILAHYATFSDAEKGDAIQTLSSRASYARAMLAAVRDGQLPRTDIHAYHIQQLLRFEDDALKQQVTDVWGAIRSTPADKLARIEELKSALPPDRLAAADRGNGRRLFDKTCATCHKLFGEGSVVGPELTGSNRANLDYLLENVVAPSAVVGKDYRPTEFELVDGRIVSGLVQLETESALTIKTVNDTIVVPKKNIDFQRVLEQSMMPEGLLDTLQAAEIRDLVAYLGSPTQVTPRGPAAPLDAETGKVPDALEGESLAVIKQTAGDAASQDMGAFRRDRWSGNSQLWWTGGEPGARLDLKLPVAEPGSYDIEIVMTKARDYGIVQLALDGQTLGGPADLFNAPEVVTTGVQTFADQRLTGGDHVLSVEILGANPQAAKAYMFGLDYVRLTPTETAGP